MTAHTDVLVWAAQVVKRKALAHQVLEIAPDASLDEAQDAFHEIARAAHPDLHRAALTPDELELVTAAYARAAAAYHEVRTCRAASRGRPLRDPDPDPRIMPPTLPIPYSATPNKAVSVAGPAAGAPARPAPAMTGKALLYYRKAELCLRRGDLTGAVLQLKLAIASDPRSGLLRSALAEVEAEVVKSR
jgi:hypothetical protein